MIVEQGAEIAATVDADPSAVEAPAPTEATPEEAAAPAEAESQPSPESAPQPAAADEAPAEEATAPAPTPLLSDEGHAVAAATPPPHERVHRPLVDLHEVTEDVAALEAEAGALWRCAVAKIMALPHFAQGELGRAQAFIRGHL